MKGPVTRAQRFAGVGPGVEALCGKLRWSKKRTQTFWGGKLLDSRHADEGFYRISGGSGSGKSHLTKLFLLDALREVESNPHAKLIVYEPKREFYAWIASLGLTVPINYFMPSDGDGVALNFARDYSSIQDSQTLADAFYPRTQSAENPFWGDSVRTIFAQVFDAIKAKMGENADLRHVLLVLEDQELTKRLVRENPYLVQAQTLLGTNNLTIGQTTDSIRQTVHSRVAQVKIVAAQLDYHKRNGRLFSIRDFIRNERSGVLVVSKDAKYKLTQDPLNATLFVRLIELLDAEQQDNARKVFVVIDEFPTLAGDDPCPGIMDMFLRLRSRGVVILITYQAITTLKRVYGEHVTESLGQCTNVIYLKQPDLESAEYAAKDLGNERGYETVTGTTHQGSEWNVTENQVWKDRPLHSPTDLMNKLRPARPTHGIEGVAKSTECGAKPWPVAIPAKYISQIPATDKQIREYDELDARWQILDGLSEFEKEILTGRTNDQERSDRWDTFMTS